MSSQGSKKDTTCGCIILIVIAIGIVVAIIRGCDKGSDSKQDASINGHDPQSFVTALDLYTETEKAPLSNNEYEEISQQFNSFTRSGTLPEYPNFRRILLQLDGATDFEKVNKLIEDSLNKYQNAYSGSMPADSSDQNLFTKGNSYYEKGDFAYAAENYTDILETNPGHLDARNNLGLCELHMGNNVAALMHFYLVMEASPQYLGAEQNLSVTLERLGLSYEALAHAENVVNSDAKLPMAQFNLGWFRTKFEDYASADASYQKAIELYDDYTKAFRASALNNLARGEELTSAELKTFSKEERNSLNSSQSQRLTTGIWWVLMILGVIIQIGFLFRAAGHNKAEAVLWGLISIIGLIIAIIVFAIWFNSSTTFYYILSGFGILNTITMGVISKKD